MQSPTFGQAAPRRPHHTLLEFAPPYKNIRTHTSVKDASSVTKKQFQTYISKIDNFSGLDYVFDGAKTSSAEAKNFMQTAMKSDSYKVFDSMNDKLKTSLGINSRLTLARQKAIFKNMVDNLDPTLFDFVKVSQ